MIRKARIEEVPEIRQFLEDREQHGIIPRSLAYLYAHLRDYSVNIGASGHMAAVAALHICWAGTGEIRSLVVKPALQDIGIGQGLVKHCLAEAAGMGLTRVFLLTLIPAYFYKFGFRVVTRDDLPPIAWADCVNCVKFPNCNETPMILDL